MRFFLAGIMQGSHLALTIHNQTYRQRIKQLLAENFPAAEIYDPLADHADSLSYDESRGREVFFHHNQLCSQVDVLLAFAPEATMGTAIEMWEAYRHGKAVIAVSPMKHNWAVRFLSHELYADLEELEAAVVSGRLAERLREVLANSASHKPQRPLTSSK
jgi:hypothetical protein